MDDVFLPLTQALDGWQAAGRIADFWLRDDDATEPTPALDRLLSLSARFSVPMTLAVIPRPTGPALAERLDAAALAEVAVHGWAHVNHAPASEKKQELGGHRPASVVLGELAGGLEKLAALHGPRCVPMLVPPWNRIDRSLVPALADIGFRALSVFGPEARPNDALLSLNTHVDLIDWHGTRGGRAPEALVREIVARLAAMESGWGVMGFLSHHLVHDAAAWSFLEGLVAATAGHPACRWGRAGAFIAR